MNGVTGIDYSRLPLQWQGGLERYFEYGVRPGSGLEAVLSNDLLEAVGRIFDGLDYERLGRDLVALCQFLYNDVEGRGSNLAWGSPEKVKAWLAQDWDAERLAARKPMP